jgi:type IV pilus assembly protein PilW
MMLVIIGAIYTTYKSQQDSYVAQDQVAEMQQNLRAAIYMMGSDVRLAGYNPGSVPNLAGFVVDLPSPNDGQGAATTATQIAFTMDANGNGVLDNLDTEQVAYRLNAANRTLERYSVESPGWVVVAEDIQTLNFVYLDGNNPPNDITGAIATDPANLAKVRQVEIDMLSRTGRVDREFRNTAIYQNLRGTTIFAATGDNYRRRLLSTIILCRNMGL